MLIRLNLASLLDRLNMRRSVEHKKYLAWQILNELVAEQKVFNMAWKMSKNQ